MVQNLNHQLQDWQKNFEEAIIKPPLRAVKYKWLYWSAQRKISKSKKKRNHQPIAFLIGCGRSGTTILGNILSQHPQISYYFEPYHLWAAIDRKTDVLNLYHSGNASLLMDESDASNTSRDRFYQLFRSEFSHQLVLEKTPLNALRIGYLNAIAPQAKFIHLVRDGVDVSYSIARLANTNAYNIAGKPKLNQWWGVNHAKWQTLVRDGVNAGYHAEEIHDLQTNASKGAYEWLVSLNEVNRWKKALDHRFQEFSYEALLANPESILKQICDFLEITVPSDWLQQSMAAIHFNRHSVDTSLALPYDMCQTFNWYQQQYSFAKRAVCHETSESEK
jgi:LPS sulfotransferase NodH